MFHSYWLAGQDIDILRLAVLNPPVSIPVVLTPGISTHIISKLAISKPD